MTATETNLFDPKAQVKRATALIKKAKAVFVWCPITFNDGVHFQVSKAEALWRVIGLEGYLHGAELRIRQDGDDVYIGG